MKTLATLALAFAASAALAQSDDDLMRRLESTRLTVDFSGGETLEGALTVVRDALHCNIALDPRIRDEQARANVNVRLTGVSAKTVLRIILGDKGLTVVLRKGVLMIVDRKSLDEKPVTRTYDVGDLVRPTVHFAAGKMNLVSSDSSSNPLVGAMLEDVKEQENPFKPDMLGEMIKAMTGEGKWDENPNAHLQIVNNTLVVSQSERVQGEVATLLARLRQFK